MTPKDVLKELFDLLEDYAPAWYTEEHRNRIAIALQDIALQNSDEVQWPRTESEEIKVTSENSVKKKQTRKISRPILAAINSRKPVKPAGGPTAQ